MYRESDKAKAEREGREMVSPGEIQRGVAVKVYLNHNNCCPTTCPYYEVEENDFYIIEWCTHPEAQEVDDGILELCPISHKPIWVARPQHGTQMEARCQN